MKIPKTEVNGKALKLSKWKMWHSDILPLQCEVKLADGERKSMAMLLLDDCTTVSFASLRPLLFISLVPEPLLLVEQQSSHYASTVLRSWRLGSGECVGLDFPSPQRP